MIEYEKISDINAVVRELNKDSHGMGGCSNCCHEGEGCALSLPMRINTHPERLSKFCKKVGITPTEYFDYFEKWNPFYRDEIRYRYFAAVSDDSLYPESGEADDRVERHRRIQRTYDRGGRSGSRNNPCWHKGCDWLDCTLLHTPFGKIVAPANGERKVEGTSKQEICVWQNENIRLTLENDNIIRHCHELDAAVVRSRFVGIMIMASQGLDVLRIKQWRRQTTAAILDLVLQKSLQYQWNTVGTLAFGNKRHDGIIPTLERWTEKYPQQIRIFYIHPEDYRDLRTSLGCSLRRRPDTNSQRQP